jgi:AcrR family transcriptional regulator
MNKEKSSSDQAVRISRAGKPRDRIFDCAQDLFHRKGIRSVGVEAIAEAAGTSKMALYRHFDSKDELIIEYAQNPGDPGGQLYGFMDKVAIFIAEDERGCDLANAAIELTEQGHPGLRVIEEFKIRQRERLTNLCKAAGASQPDLLADTLFLLIEGARVSRRSVGTKGPSASLVRTSRGVIASFGVRPPDARQSIPEQ